MQVKVYKEILASSKNYSANFAVNRATPPLLFLHIWNWINYFYGDRAVYVLIIILQQNV